MSFDNKKFRYEKGKKKPRKETEAERRERLFPGHDLQRQLSKGIVEEEDDDQREKSQSQRDILTIDNAELAVGQDDDCLVDDELSDDDHEDDDDCLIPLSWAKLATNDPEIQKKMTQTIQESRSRVLEKKKSKPKKKNCSPGNPLHSTSGEFTGKGKKGSWSIRTKGEDCNYGQLKTTGRGNEKRWTKTTCGREDPKDDNKKAKYKCKDGSLNEEENNFRDDVWDKTLMQLQDRLQKLLDRDPQFLKRLAYLLKPMTDMEREESNMTIGQAAAQAIMNEKKKGRKNPLHALTRDQSRTYCASLGFFGWTDFLMKLNAIEAAKKGNIPNRK